MEQGPKHLFFSFGRLWTIVRNTMTEVIRQKFFYILVIFGVLVLFFGWYFSQFSSVERIKFVKDFGLGAIMVFSSLVAIVGTSQLLPLELENRTIYPILAKPVHRAEFLLGKFLGMITLLLLTVLLMSVIFGGLIFYTEQRLMDEASSGRVDPSMYGQSVATGAAHGEIERQIQGQIRKQTRDPGLVKAVILIYCKALIVCAVTLLISTFATSVIFTVTASFILYLCGHLESTARQAWLGDPSLLTKFMVLAITFFVPDLNVFNKADDIVVGKPVEWAYVWNAAGYGLFYIAVVLLAAYFIFEEKEI